MHCIVKSTIYSTKSKSENKGGSIRGGAMGVPPPPENRQLILYFFLICSINPQMNKLLLNSYRIGEHTYARTDNYSSF